MIINCKILSQVIFLTMITMMDPFFHIPGTYKL